MIRQVQSATGVIQDRVTDATGAPDPIAKVTVDNLQTGVRLVLLGNSGGLSYQLFLVPGDCRVTVEHRNCVRPHAQKNVFVFPAGLAP